MCASDLTKSQIRKGDNIMMMKKCMNDMCKMYCDAKRGMNTGMNFLNSLSLKNRSDIDVSLKSSDREKPIWGCKFNCNKEIKVLPVIGIILGVMLIMTLLCSSDCKDCKKDEK